MTTRRLNVDVVRSHFPALSRKQAGRTVAFLDGPAGAQVPNEVIEAMAAYLRRGIANDGAVFSTSLETSDVVRQAREAAADFLGSDPEEIAFGQSMTALNFSLAHAVARTFESGDEVVVTELDHDANITPWLLVARDHGLRVRSASIRRSDGTLNEDALIDAISDRTRLIAFTLASNALGSIPDCRRIAKITREAGALAWGDGVHLAPHQRVDRAGLGLDVVLVSPYKFFGPHQGIAAIDLELAQTLPADQVRTSEGPPGHRFEAGTQAFEAMAGTVAAINYIAGLGRGVDRRARLIDAYARIQAHERALSQHFLEQVRTIGAVQLYGIAQTERAAERTPTFAFNVGSHRPIEVAQMLAKEGIYVYHGDFYAPAPLRALGVHDRGVVRAGFLHYTTMDEVQRLIDALRRVARG